MPAYAPRPSGKRSFSDRRITKDNRGRRSGDPAAPSPVISIAATPTPSGRLPNYTPPRLAVPRGASPWRGPGGSAPGAESSIPSGKFLRPTASPQRPESPQRLPPPRRFRPLPHSRASEVGGSKGGVPLAGVQGRGVPGGGPGAAPPAPSHPSHPANFYEGTTLEVLTNGTAVQSSFIEPSGFAYGQK